MTSANGARSPLDGITVLDMTIWQNGPWATAMLSDMGADVIKVEDPVKGDPGRVTRVYLSSERPVNHYFQTMNRNKRAMTIDLKQEEGREIFYRLVEKADVVTQNFRKGVVEKLGVDYETVRKINPRIIYGSSNGLGPKGPDANLGVMDILGSARSGHMWLMSHDEEGNVAYRVAGGQADQVGAVVLAYGVLLGIIARERFGVGQHVQTSQLGSVVMMQALALNGYLLNGDLPKNPPRETTQNALWNIYKCGDGNWLAIGCPQSDRYWSDFTRVMDIAHLEDEPRFKDHNARQSSSEELIRILDKIFLTKPRDHWLKEFAARQISGAPVQDYPQLRHDPQVLENGYITQVPHPELGEITEVGVPVALSETPGYARRSAPEFGQHTEEVLLANGYDWDQIEGFRERGVI